MTKQYFFVYILLFSLPPPLSPCNLSCINDCRSRYVYGCPLDHKFKRLIWIFFYKSLHSLFSPSWGGEAPPKMLVAGCWPSPSWKTGFSAQFSVWCPRSPQFCSLPSAIWRGGDTHQPHYTAHIANRSTFLSALLLLSRRNVEQWVQNVYNAYST